MADGRVVASGTVAGIIGGRQVVEVRCAGWRRAYAVLDAAGLVVQVHGQDPAVLRVAADVGAVAGLLSQAGLDAAARPVPAHLDEAFVALVSSAAA
jgi:hypothetical protein